jgi:acyl carrier protein
MKPILITSLCFFLLLTLGCGVQRDDTTTTMRQLVSTQLGITYDNAKPEATLAKLGCDDLDFVELIMEIEESFDISISEEELDTLGGAAGWQAISVLDLANLVRKKRK